MRRNSGGHWAWIAVALLAACAGPPVPVEPVKAVEARPPASPKAPAGPYALGNATFEKEPRAGETCATNWACTAHANARAFRFSRQVAADRRSYCVEPAPDAKKQEPWAQVTQGLFDPGLRGTRVRFSLALQLTGLTGEGAGPWIQAQIVSSKGGKPTSETIVRQTVEWQRYSVEMDIPESAVSVEVGLILKGGGRACFGDARLEVLP
jgi:hypothetical protein